MNAFDNQRTARNIVFSDADREKVRDVFARIIDEMSDCGQLEGMIPEYAWVVSHVLRNRRIARELSEVPSDLVIFVTRRETPDPRTGVVHRDPPEDDSAARLAVLRNVNA